jgi:hypothetical protein
VPNLSAKLKYKNETPPHAVFDRVSAGVSTYIAFAGAVLFCAKVQKL